MTPVLPMQRSGTVVDARLSLAIWLRAGRTQRKMSLEDVARITKIQVRILERIEAGTIKPSDGMPADVFVRGFVRSIARCVGLDEAEALRRYTEAAAQAALDLSPGTVGPAARALVDSMAELAPHAARTSSSRDSQPAIEPAGEIVVEAPIEVVDAAATDGKRKKSKKGTGKGRGKRRDMATGTPFLPTPVVAPTELAPTESVEMAIATAIAVDPSEPVAIETSTSTAATEPVGDVVGAVAAVVLEPGQTWSPRMPVAVAPTVPWRLNASAQTLARKKSSTARIVPSIVIDDSDPDLAERELEDRATRSMGPSGSRTFLPPILLDREDRSARQGGLTLAVIIVLIAATLTLSYLMRRPSSSGDGVTQADLVESVDPVV